MSNVTINFNNTTGIIKPMHGIGAGPITDNFSRDASDLYSEIGIPYARTHDVEYPFGSGEFVDIHCIFRNFDADVEDENSYNFVFTDEYLKAIEATGCKVFYRLGETIEHQPIKRYIYPPKDYLKWAKICEHIIMHYTQGWANGFHMDIEYWEIWNEPDGDGNCWIGTEEEFFELYTVAINYLKGRFPHLKFGGCAFCGDRPMSGRFLEYISARKVPLDFFSWHDYATNPEFFVERYNSFDNKLKQNGYSQVENICDEWNYVIDWKDRLPESKASHKTHVGAAFNASMMISFQTKTNLSKSMYYNGCSDWCGLFSPGEYNDHGGIIKAVPEKPFYVHKMFGELYRMGNETEVMTDAIDLYVLAANGEYGKGAMICRFNDCSQSREEFPESEIAIDIASGEKVEYYLVDENHCFEKVEADEGIIKLKNYSVLYVKVI